MSTQPEALRLAAELEACPSINYKTHAAELRRLHDDAEESEALRERLSALLRSTAIALRGPEPELTSYGWHDLPARAAAVVAQRDALLEALKLIDKEFKKDGRHHWPEAVKARAAIKSVEE